jgi:hypothetical protein
MRELRIVLSSQQNILFVNIKTQATFGRRLKKQNNKTINAENAENELCMFVNVSSREDNQIVMFNIGLTVNKETKVSLRVKNMRVKIRKK